MDWLYLVYALLAAVLFFGAKAYGKGKWNDEFMSLDQTKIIQGFAAICIAFHHMGQKTCAPWHKPLYIVHGLDVFVPIGYMLVGIFLFCSGFGLIKSIMTKENYLKGFVRRRIVPLIVMFYVTEWIFLIVRFLMHEKMDGPQIFFYVIGAQLANPNAWYVIAMPFFYLFFYFSFKYIKKKDIALLVTCLLVFAYITLGTFIDHNDWWMRGEWWYNSAHLFILGLLFARFEEPIVKHIKKFYYLYLVLAFVGLFFFFGFGEHAKDIWSYYGETFGADHVVLRRWGCLVPEMLASSAFVIFVFLCTMKIQLGNLALKLMGNVTLEFYLIHGLFVDLFGFDFLEVTKSLKYIRNVPLYVLVVLACSIPATIILKLINNKVKV